MRILLIAGHGQGDPGAVGNGYKEADLTREFVRGLIPLLEPFADVDVYAFSKKLSSRLAKGEKFDFTKYDYVFEIHFNAFNKQAQGAEIIVHTSEKSTKVEKIILENIKKLGFANRGIKKRNDLIVANTCKGKQNTSYALLEVCFIDNADDINLYQKLKGEYIFAVANGIISGFNLLNASYENNLEKIVNFLSEKGVLSDVDLWMEKATLDDNVLWLLKKTYNVLGGE